MVLSKKELELLRSELPYGSIKKIALAVGVTPEYAQLVFKGKAFNDAVIDEAIRIRDAHRERIISLKKAIAR